MEALQLFVRKFDDCQVVPFVHENEIHIVAAALQDIKCDDAFKLRVLQCLAYLSMDYVVGPTVLDRIQHYLDLQDDSTKTRLVDGLIEKLKPMLLKGEHTRGKNIGLNPKLGLSLKNDEAKEKWKQQGGLKSISLFKVVLLHLPRSAVSRNLGWITPGLLNLLDDTSDLYGIKLKGVELCKVFWSCCFADDKMIQFKDTGLFDLFEPTLTSMCFYTPPIHTEQECLDVWKQVYPALLLLYQVQQRDAIRNVQKLLTQVILQTVIPRISSQNELLTCHILTEATQIVEFLQNRVVTVLQRLIYTIGEYLVRNPFLTAFDKILNKTIKLLGTIIKWTPSERLLKHKYDFYALIIILYEKCANEGQPETLKVVRSLAQSLQQRNCYLISEEIRLLQKSRPQLAPLFAETH